MKKLLHRTRSFAAIPKFDLKMKLSSLFILLGFITHANSTFSQKNRLTLESENITVLRLLDEIEIKTDYKFVYKTKDVDLNRSISVKANNKPVIEILENVFKNTTTDFRVIKNQIFLTKSSNTPPAHKTIQFNVQGQVYDENNEPFPGVNVIEKNSSNGVITDLNGHYSIDLDPTDTLLFSYLGYKTLEKPVNSNGLIIVKMIPQSSELDEIVINGIYKRKKESFTGAAKTMTGEEIRKTGNLNLFQAIQNLDPTISLADNFAQGSNPNSLPDIQIRGTSTFPEQDGVGADLKGNYLKDPNQPLFILNGFEVPVERVFDLNINRIEMISVLKDAASKALYGSRAANGVVVIETKQLSDQKALITYNASLDFELPDLSSYNLANSLEKLEAETIDGYYFARTSDDFAELQQLYNARKELALEGLNTDWLAKPLRNGIGQRHSLTVELGSDNLRIEGNLSYRNTKGVMKGSSRENITGGLTAFYRIKNFRFRNIMNVIGNEAVESPYGEFADYAKMNPYWRATNLDGSIPYYAEIGQDGAGITNPLYNSTLDSRNETGYFNFINNFYMEWDFLPDFKATTRIGLDIKKSDADEFYPSRHTKFENYVGNLENRKGSYQVNNGESKYVYGDLNVQWSKNINKNFYFINSGFNISERQFSEVIHTVEGFPSSRFDDIIFGDGYALDSRPTGLSGLAREVGFLAIGSYVYDNRFLSDVTVRTNASSLFGADKRWATFWSVGLGWNLHNENFLKNSIFEQLKIRGSLGSTGNQNFNTNEAVATYAYYLEDRYQGFPGSYVQNLANSALQWESKFDYNIGLDSKIGNLSLRFDYYESYTKNLITDINVPPSTGFNSVKENLGEVKNWGIEADASLLVWSEGNNFINLNAGIATNQNKIIDLSDALRNFNEQREQQAIENETGAPVIKYEDGRSLNAIWAVPSLGIDPATGKEIYVKQDGSTTYEWDSNDLKVVGNSSPKYRGIFGISGEYEGFGLVVRGRYLGGGQLYNQTLIDKVENVDMNYNVDKRVLTGRWRYQGQNTFFKGLRYYNYEAETYYYDVPPTLASSRFVQDREELEIASVNVYYDFKPSMIESLKLKRLKIGFIMNNVAQFSSIRIERGTLYPFSRSMSFNLTANF